MKFKKILIMLLLLINAKPVFSYSASKSDDIVYNGMVFEEQRRYPDTLILIGYNGTDENLVIPEHIGEYTVTAINTDLFKDNQNIKNVTLPDTINYFGSKVFSNSSLVSVNIPKSLIVIPSDTFSKCSALETVVFHENIALISDTAFEDTYIEIPPELHDKVTDQYVYASETMFESSDDEWEYWLCYWRDDINVYLVKYIGNNYTEIVIPDFIDGFPVTDIDPYSFRMTPDIKSIHFPETMVNPDLRFLGFSGSELEEITLPYMDSIPKRLFKDCKNLRKVNFQGNPEKFTIGEYAFENCTSIDYIPYPESCTNIDIQRNAFANTAVSELKIDIDSTIGEDAFLDCKNLSYVELNNTSVNSRTFRRCPELEDATITGNSVIKESGFYDCGKLKNITVEDLSILMENAIGICPEFMTINNQNAFDDTTGDFNKDFKEFILSNFYGVDDVGFINMYVKAQARKIVDEITNENMSDVQKIKAIHDWICENTVYDDNTIMDRKNHNDASIFMNDSTVCEGYTRIANIMYNTAGIESYYVESKNHAWNIVRAGNNYFHVDTTWDDGENVSYDWFMKSDEELRESGGSHEQWSADIPSSLHSFQKDTLPECTYSMGDINQDKSVSIADMVMLNRSILNKSDIDYDSFVLADLNFDGIVDSFDLVKMREMILKRNYIIGDVNQDNKISIEDMIMLNKYIFDTDNIDYDSYALADFNSDGVVDSFDLVQMRKLITS
ncbi:MAG: leucine-rich repeat protein [Ruminococcus sp.]|nr:leucine-rich repeat protein [Ruminococcus sp.]